MPKDGTAKAWITSAPVVWTRTTLLTGTTISLSTPSRRGWSSSVGVLQHERVELELAVIGIGVGPVPLLAGALMVRSALRDVELEEQERNDGTAMTTRISTGITVHSHLEQRVVGGARGIGLALALNFTITMTRSASTNSVIRVMIRPAGNYGTR